MECDLKCWPQPDKRANAEVKESSDALKHLKPLKKTFFLYSVNTYQNNNNVYFKTNLMS